LAAATTPRPSVALLDGGVKRVHVDVQNHDWKAEGDVELIYC
jgi:hypothetical protein